MGNTPGNKATNATAFMSGATQATENVYTYKMNGASIVSASMTEQGLTKDS
jgi:hypothetical protein